MHFSVENRVPFLDKSLVDYTLSLPENWLVGDDGTTKSILRDAVRSLVPDSVIRRRDKVGFEGDEHWIQAQHTTMVRSIRDAPDIGFLDKRKVLEKLESSSRRGRVSANQLWRIFNLYRWMELLGVQGT
jgi:asparagine synthase (glutamine-hydrolysing)|tara:strand:- start:136 stop:522 length:387 start_codon:yes stop_codon:yes gene_type:complete